jgi:hypothetical protein
MEGVPMKVSDDRRAVYLEAYDDWQTKLVALHEVLLEGTKTPVGDQWKGLLNREARAKAKYDEARASLLGFGAAEGSPFD